MSEEIGLIYINLSQLLDDICLFLRDGVNKEIFSSETQKQAETLIKRSKIQLQQISNITNGECYMQMDEQRTVDDDKEDEEVEEEDLIYMDAEDEKEIPVENNDVCPFAGVPVRDLPLDDKHGYIYMKTKFIFGFEKLKRIYAVIHKDWFLIYSNDKDSKPCNAYCLRIHKAQMIATTKQGEHETELFALINQNTKQKWQFLAQTHKDMLQWITRINRYSQNDERQPHKFEKSPRIEEVPVIETCINSEEDSDEGEHYDTVILKVENGIKKEEKLEDEEEEIYEVIRPQSPHKSSQNPFPKPEVVTLPTKRQQTPLPPLPVERKESSESLVSYDNPVSMEQWGKQSTISETPSFSEDEEQEIYDVLVAASPTVQENEDEQVSIDLTETPKKEVTGSPLISSLKEKLLQSSPVTMPKQKPPPPKRLSTDRKLSINSMGSPNKDQSPKSSPLRNPFRPTSSNNSPTSPTMKSSFPKPNLQPKPSLLTKPKIDVKLIKPAGNTKSSTKQVMKLAKEISLK
ncbi:uncharacterized protein LOC123321473 [Coccinella septempunctata]|uniref:uncharacterized protein LOC123321473 n=1 Tax=Coccinella septempunctata TaxID=41139 RepID=UPI001D07F06F|nr:uncharacterized protein LOC123321473 [Coccinella septempunctata]